MSFTAFKKVFSFKRAMAFWYRHYKAMFFALFLAVFAVGGYFWYNTLYQYHWTDERKKEFIEANFKATAFKEKAFRQLVTDLKNRAVRNEKALPLTRDIFSGKSL